LLFTESLGGATAPDVFTATPFSLVSSLMDVSVRFLITPMRVSPQFNSSVAGERPPKSDIRVYVVKCGRWRPVWFSLQRVARRPDISLSLFANGDAVQIGHYLWLAAYAQPGW